MAVHRETWTDEKVATLRQMHEAGEPFSSIGFAVGMTRNATIGKARRLGLMKREMRKTAIKAAREPKPKAARPDKPRGIMPAGGLPKDPDARRDVFCAIADKANERFAATSAAVVGADNSGVLFLERGLFQCAMPMAGWDEVPVQEKRVCGRAVKVKPREGLMSSYCPACSRLVYAPAGFQAFKERSMGART
jgi:hypothetical protein